MHLRRPSASMVVSLIALFASLGGVGYAASQLPNGSVGSAQLQTFAVTNHKLGTGSVGNHKIENGAIGPRKMENGAIGAAQINSAEVQERVGGTCSSGAVTSVTDTGAVTCASAPSQEYDVTSAAPVTVPATSTTPTPIASESVPSGSSYIAFANPYVQVTGTPIDKHVTVQCTLTVGTSMTATQSRSVTVDTPASGDNETTSIPLVVTAPSSTTSSTASVTCAQTTTNTTSPTVAVSSDINVLQTAANTTATPTMSAARRR